MDVKNSDSCAPFQISVTYSTRDAGPRYLPSTIVLSSPLRTDKDSAGTTRTQLQTARKALNSWSAMLGPHRRLCDRSAHDPGIAAHAVLASKVLDGGLLLVGEFHTDGFRVVLPASIVARVLIVPSHERTIPSDLGVSNNFDNRTMGMRSEMERRPSTVGAGRRSTKARPRCRLREAA
jgi:hypothetical protein